MKIKPFKNCIKEKKIESNYYNHFKIRINIMYIHFFTHLWTNGDSIAHTCHNKEKKKKKKHGLFSMYELQQKIKIMAPKYLVHTRSISS